MVVVKVRETYDLHTVQNKMTLIAIHTPKPDIIKKNFPGLLMQCKAYRPVSADVAIACASMMPLDVQSVGTAPGDVSPEDVFNPILYKAMSNFGMSQLEARINALRSSGSSVDVDGNTAMVDVDTVTNFSDEFGIYYGLLSNAHGWKHAMPQSGLNMENLRPLVYEMLYNVGDNTDIYQGANQFSAPGSGSDQPVMKITPAGIRGNAKPLPFINCTSYTGDTSANPPTGIAVAGFPDVYNSEIEVPWINCCVGAIIIPPSRLHELFFRMTVVWNIEFSQIRPIGEIMNYLDLNSLGAATHYQNYDYSATKEAVTGSKDTILEKDTCMVSSNVDVDKVM